MSIDKSESVADDSLADQDCITVTDRASRRRFIRTGSAFLLGSAAAGAAIAAPSSSQILVADCDSGGSGEKKPEHAGNGSDSDSGANADPAGCGRRYEDKPKLSKIITGAPHTHRS